jgi:hypothetical protein
MEKRRANDPKKKRRKTCEALPANTMCKPHSMANAEETRALVELIRLGDEDVLAGRIKPLIDVVARLRDSRRA